MRAPVATSVDWAGGGGCERGWLSTPACLMYDLFPGLFPQVGAKLATNVFVRCFQTELVVTARCRQAQHPFPCFSLRSVDARFCFFVSPYASCKRPKKRSVCGFPDWDSYRWTFAFTPMCVLRCGTRSSARSWGRKGRGDSRRQQGGGGGGDNIGGYIHGQT